MVKLTKEQKIDLTKDNAGLKKVTVGLGWDVNSNGGAEFDLDACAVTLDKDGKSTGTPIYFGNLTGAGIKHTGDNLTGEGDGDDEQIIVNLNEVPENVETIVVGVSIYQAAQRGGQTFGRVNNSFIRLVNSDTNEELAKYDLNEDYSSYATVEMGKLYRHNGEWKFQALGNGVTGEMGEFFSKYGIQ